VPRNFFIPKLLQLSNRYLNSYNYQIVSVI